MTIPPPAKIGLVAWIPRGVKGGISRHLKGNGWRTGSSVLWWAQDTRTARAALGVATSMAVSHGAAAAAAVLRGVEVPPDLEWILAGESPQDPLGFVSDMAMIHPADHLAMMEALRSVPAAMARHIVRSVARVDDPHLIPPNLRSAIVAAVQELTT